MQANFQNVSNLDKRSKYLTQIETQLSQHPNHCPQVKEPCFPGAQYAWLCASNKRLCSCTWWMHPEAYNNCSWNKTVGADSLVT